MKIPDIISELYKKVLILLRYKKTNRYDTHINCVPYLITRKYLGQTVVNITNFYQYLLAYFIPITKVPQK